MKIALFYNPQSFDAPPQETSRISLKCLIFLETRIIDLHFPTDSLCLSSFNFFVVGTATSRKTFLFLKKRHFRLSMACKVTAVCANRKRVCDFLLVRNSNFGPILHRFGDMTGFMCYLPHPYSTLILGCSRCTRSPMLGVSQSRGPKLFGREIIFQEFQRI